MVDLINRNREPPNCLDFCDNRITTPVVVPYKCGCRCRCDCDCDDIKTHARDTIIVPKGTARTTVMLDDGSDQGFPFPLPLNCMELRFRFKGEKCTCFTTRSLKAEWDGSITVMWDREWDRSRYGYYEAELVMNPNSPSEVRAGWLLFLRKPARSTMAASYENIIPEPERVSRCAPVADSVGEKYVNSGDDCTGCGGCK